MKNKKLANFSNPKWTYKDLKCYARKYRNKLCDLKKVPDVIKCALVMYQSQSRELLIINLKKVQAYLYK